MTDAEKKDQFERETRIKERKAAAYELGYTKEADPLKEAGKFLLGAIIPGGGLLAGMDKPEKGTIMPDGTIADGDGNTFDPRTGEQVGGKGFLGFGKSVAEERDMEGAAIPESSIAGLRSLAGEDSIKDLLASLPEEVKVASTTMAGAGQTVGEAAKVDDPTSKLPQIPGDPFSDPRKAGQAKDPTTMLPQIPGDPFSDPRKAGQTVSRGRTPSTMLPQIPGDPFSDPRKAGQSTRVTTPDTKKIDPSGRPSTQKLDTKGISPTGRPRTPLEDAVFNQKTIRDTLAKAKNKDPKQFRRDVKAGKYNAEYAKIDKERENENLIRNSKPNKAGVNLAEKVGEKFARKIEDRQGTATNVDTNTGQIFYDKEARLVKAYTD